MTIAPAASWRRVLALLGPLLLALSVAACRSPDPDAVRFAVFTDAHVFDEKARDVTEILRHSAQDRDALRWAVATIDRQPALDFVVYAGDWGLENVDFAGSGCDAHPVAVRDDRLQPFPWKAAGSCGRVAKSTLLKPMSSSQTPSAVAATARSSGPVRASSM